MRRGFFATRNVILTRADCSAIKVEPTTPAAPVVKAEIEATRQRDPTPRRHPCPTPASDDPPRGKAKRRKLSTGTSTPKDRHASSCSNDSAAEDQAVPGPATYPPKCEIPHPVQPTSPCPTLRVTDITPATKSLATPSPALVSPGPRDIPRKRPYTPETQAFMDSLHDPSPPFDLDERSVLLFSIGNKPFGRSNRLRLPEISAALAALPENAED